MTTCEQLVSELQRTQSPRLLAVLVRIFGVHNFDLAEDVLQEAFFKALLHWKTNGIPSNPQAWLMQTAKNQALDFIRQSRTQLNYAQDLTLFLESEWTTNSTLDSEFTEHRIKDDQLRMLFMCCHQHLSSENRLPFMLKHLCGLSISAISNALFIPEATLKKRLLRSRKKLHDYQFTLPNENELPHALNNVHTALYLLFNEGFHASAKEILEKGIFCRDAMGLVDLLIDEKSVANQDTFALLALMHFQMARLESKNDQHGQPIPIDLQDRSNWNKSLIFKGSALLDLASKITVLGTGRFYIEAQIAQQHCLANSFSQTPWSHIYHLYQCLFELTASPVTQLNLAVAQGYSGELDLAIKLVGQLCEDPVFKHSHLPLATLAHLNAMQGNEKQAWRLADQATEKGGDKHEHKIMRTQIQRLLVTSVKLD
ncbi:MAG: sigma-70 family RNA polymerase sigma factor [Aliiglaciecola sp.]|uniref:RNA polymerase sigma factor n=1 Tax=Aliiglaciecola sp. TaxID=1872441 RepID=UPI00329936F7